MQGAKTSAEWLRSYRTLEQEIQWLECQQQANAERLTLDKAQLTRLEQIIKQVDGIEAVVLRKKYVDGMSLTQIAADPQAHTSISTVKKVHAALMRTLKFVDENGTQNR